MKGIENEVIGRKMIKNAVNLDECLVHILKIEIKRLRRLLKSSNALEDLQKTNYLIRNIIIALMITDEKIRTGIELCFGNIENNHS